MARLYVVLPLEQEIQPVLKKKKITAEPKNIWNIMRADIIKLSITFYCYKYHILQKIKRIKKKKVGKRPLWLFKVILKIKFFSPKYCFSVFINVQITQLRVFFFFCYYLLGFFFLTKSHIQKYSRKKWGIKQIYKTIFRKYSRFHVCKFALWHWRWRLSRLAGSAIGSLLVHVSAAIPTAPALQTLTQNSTM